MNEKAGAQISRRAFIQSAVILLAMMLVAGVLTLVLPAGEYQRTLRRADRLSTRNPIG